MALQHPNEWLKKQLDIEDVAVSIQARHTAPAASLETTPLLRTRRLSIAALAPVFAVLADRAVVGQTTAVIDINLAPIQCNATDQQIGWLRTFADTIPTVLAARGVLFDYTKRHSLAQLLPHYTMSGCCSQSDGNV